MKKHIAAILMLSIILSSFPLYALAEASPQTTNDTKTFSLNILTLLPGAIKSVWNNQALPIWRNMWAWFKNFWESSLGGWIENLWQKLWKLTGKDTPDVKNEFQKEQQEMQNDFWTRFKDLLK